MNVSSVPKVKYCNIKFWYLCIYTDTFAQKSLKEIICCNEISTYPEENHKYMNETKSNQFYWTLQNSCV